MASRWPILTPGFVQIGTSPSGTGDTIDPGILSGLVTMSCCKVHLTFSGDNNNNAYVQVNYRRLNEVAWDEGINLFRMGKESSFTGSLFGLKDNQTYDIEIKVFDPDFHPTNPVATLTTTFTTRRMPRFPNTRVIAATPANLSTLQASAQPGDRYELATGNYSGFQFTQSGTYDEPIMYTAADSATPKWTSSPTFANGLNHVWIDNCLIGDAGARINDFIKLPGDGSSNTHEGCIFTRLTCYTDSSIAINIGSSVGSNSKDHAFLDLFIESSGSCFELRRFTIENPTGLGVISAFCELKGIDTSNRINDAWSGGMGNNDIHNNWLHLIGDDPIELDNKGPGGDNIRVWDCLFGPYIGPSILSLDDQYECPIYFFRVQATGSMLNITSLPNDLFKSSGVIPGNVISSLTTVMEASKNQSVNEDGDDLINRGIWCNNMMADGSPNYPSGSAAHYILGGPTPVGNHVYIDHNAYDLEGTGNLHDWGNLAFHQGTLGTEINSTSVDAETVLTNTPVDRKIGTSERMMPVIGQALENTGTPISSFRGASQILGPYVGSKHDKGCNQIGIGPPPVGPRTYSDRLLYSLPVDWTSEPTANVGNYTDQGLPATDTISSKLLLSRTGPIAAIFIDIDEYSTPAEAWTAYDDLLDGEPGDTIDEGPLYFRDGLGITFLTRGTKKMFIGARVEDGGLTTITGGILNSESDANKLLVQENCCYIVQSMWYEFGPLESIPSSLSSSLNLTGNLKSNLIPGPLKSSLNLTGNLQSNIGLAGQLGVSLNLTSNLQSDITVTVDTFNVLLNLTSNLQSSLKLPEVKKSLNAFIPSFWVR
jgi:hypothetical protein